MTTRGEMSATISMKGKILYSVLRREMVATIDTKMRQIRKEVTTVMMAIITTRGEEEMEHRGAHGSLTCTSKRTSITNRTGLSTDQGVEIILLQVDSNSSSSEWGMDSSSKTISAVQDSELASFTRTCFTEKDLMMNGNEHRFL